MTVIKINFENACAYIHVRYRGRLQSTIQRTIEINVNTFGRDD
jgi:hypothetical protein